MSAKPSVPIFFFHVITVLYYAYLFDYCNRRLVFKTKTKYILTMEKFNDRFFTAWNMGVQFGYFIISLLEDILQFSDMKFSIKLREQVKEWRNYIFRTFAFPLAFTVASLFWVLVTYDKELVVPDEVHNVLPSWLNHALHTNIVIFVSLEVLFTDRSYPRARKSMFAGLFVYFALWCVSYLQIYLQHDVWLYPIHGILNWPQKIFMLVTVFTATLGIAVTGQIINSKLWGYEVDCKNMKIKSS